MVIKRKRRMGWFVAQILPKSEYKIQGFIESDQSCVANGVRVWYPKRKAIIAKKGKRVIVDEPLYPNYMLFYLPMTDNTICKRIEEETLVLYFLTDQNNGKLLALTDDEIKSTEELCNELRNLDINQLIGKKVHIVKGPFKNMIGNVKSLIKNSSIVQVRVEIDLFGNVLRPEINIDYLEEIE